MRKYSYSLAQHFIYKLVKVTRFFHYMFRLNIRVIFRWFLILRYTTKVCNEIIFVPSEISLGSQAVC